MAKLLLALALALVAIHSVQAQSTWQNLQQLSTSSTLDTNYARFFASAFSYYGVENPQAPQSTPAITQAQSWIVLVNGAQSDSGNLLQQIIQSGGATGGGAIGQAWNAVPTPPFAREGHVALSCAVSSNAALPGQAAGTAYGATGANSGWVFLVIAGFDATTSQPTADFWRSTDLAVTWTQNIFSWPSRAFHGASLFNNGQNIIVFGGRGAGNVPLQDTWLSTDYGASFPAGIATTTQQNGAFYPARWGFAFTTTFAEIQRITPTLFLIGGTTTDNDALSDVWYGAVSNAGVSWQQVQAAGGSSQTYLFQRVYAAATWIPPSTAQTGASSKLLVTGGKVPSAGNANLLVVSNAVFSTNPNSISQNNLLTWTDECQTNPDGSSSCAQSHPAVYGHNLVTVEVASTYGGAPQTQQVYQIDGHDPNGPVSSVLLYNQGAVQQVITSYGYVRHTAQCPATQNTPQANQISCTNVQPSTNGGQGQACFTSNSFSQTCYLQGQSQVGVQKPVFDCVRTVTTNGAITSQTTVATTPDPITGLPAANDACAAAGYTLPNINLDSCTLSACAYTVIASGLPATVANGEDSTVRPGPVCDVNTYPSGCAESNQVGGGAGATTNVAYSQIYWCQDINGNIQKDPATGLNMVAWPFVVSVRNSPNQNIYSFNPASYCAGNTATPDLNTPSNRVLSNGPLTCPIQSCNQAVTTYSYLPLPQNQQTQLNACIVNNAGTNTNFCNQVGQAAQTGYYFIQTACYANGNTANGPVSSSLCQQAGVAIPAQSAFRSAQYNIYQCNTVPLCNNVYWSAVGYNQCKRTVSLVSPSLPSGIRYYTDPTTNLQIPYESDYCYAAAPTVVSTTPDSSAANLSPISNVQASPNLASSPPAQQQPVYQCYQGGVAVDSSICTQAGVVQSGASPIACKLLPCIANAQYLPIGLGQCINTANQATCCQRDTTLPSPYVGVQVTNQVQCTATDPNTGLPLLTQRAPTLFQCTYNGEGYPGQCVAPYPNPNNPGSLTTLTTNQPITYYQLCTLPYCGIQGDPEFVGFRGQRYEIHGIPGSVFNIISSPSVQYNAEFVFLGAKSDRACNDSRTHPWTHPGTYLGTLGFMVGTDRVQILPGDCETGIRQLTVNGKELSVGDVHHFTGSAKQVLSYTDEFTVHMALTEVDVTLQNSDMFFNQEVSLTKTGQHTKVMHGLLGQTWSTRTYRDEQGHKHFIEGHPNDYLIQDDDIFGTDFMYNRFESKQ